MAHLKALPAAVEHEATDKSQRFLISAHEAVEGVFDTLYKIRDLRKGEGGGIQGQMTHPENDQLRAAIVFSGAGLDATLKQMIRGTLPLLLEAGNEQAHKKFETFASDKLGTGEIADTGAIARYLTSANPRERLIEDYIYDLTGSSLQSKEEVQKVVGALGVNDKELREKVGKLKPLFTARNEISHELDLQSPEKAGDRTRRSRPIGQTKTICNSAFEVAQLLVNDVGSQLT
jgi:hypothetical protein